MHGEAPFERSGKVGRYLAFTGVTVLERPVNVLVAIFPSDFERKIGKVSVLPQRIRAGHLYSVHTKECSSLSFSAYRRPVNHAKPNVRSCARILMNVGPRLRHRRRQSRRAARRSRHAVSLRCTCGNQVRTPISRC